MKLLLEMLLLHLNQSSGWVATAVIFNLGDATAEFAAVTHVIPCDTLQRPLCTMKSQAPLWQWVLSLAVSMLPNELMVSDEAVSEYNKEILDRERENRGVGGEGCGWLTGCSVAFLRLCDARHSCVRQLCMNEKTSYTAGSCRGGTLSLPHYYDRMSASVFSEAA